MKDIDFSYNWNNKLENNCYSTIRIHNEKKYVAEKLYNIYLKNEFLHVAKILKIKTFALHDLSDIMAYLDTGYDKEETIKIINKMYKEKAYSLYYDFIILKRLKDYEKPI